MTSMFGFRAGIATIVLLVAPAVAAGDVVTQWNEKPIASSAAAGGQNPLVVSRTMAIATADAYIAVFDSTGVSG